MLFSVLRTTHNEFVYSQCMQAGSIITPDGGASWFFCEHSARLNLDHPFFFSSMFYTSCFLTLRTTLFRAQACPPQRRQGKK